MMSMGGESIVYSQVVFIRKSKIVEFLKSICHPPKKSSIQLWTNKKAFSCDPGFAVLMPRYPCVWAIKWKQCSLSFQISGRPLLSRDRPLYDDLPAEGNKDNTNPYTKSVMEMIIDC